MKKIIDSLGSYSYSKGRDFSLVFEDLLDWLIATFDVENVIGHKLDYSAIFEERKEDNPVFFEVLIRWAQMTEAGVNNKGSFDFFGTMYEEVVKGKFKSSAMGQFFTPLPLCKMMGEMVLNAHDVTINDCACGSGRTLLGHWAVTDKTKFHYYVGEDLDPVCVKMCTLNFMMNGMMGLVVHHDALAQDFLGAYEVNEIKWPFPNPACSIRKLNEAQYQSRIQWLVARAKGKSIKQTCEFVMQHNVPEDEEPSAPVPLVPRQLSLFNLDEL